MKKLDVFTYVCNNIFFITLQEVDKRNNEDRPFDEIFGLTDEEMDDLLMNAIDFEEDDVGLDEEEEPAQPVNNNNEDSFF